MGKSALVVFYPTENGGPFFHASCIYSRASKAVSGTGIRYSMVS